MFRYSLTSKQFIALLLPMVFFWSWAACAAFCSEVELHKHNSPNLSKKIDSASDCLTENPQADSCSMTSQTVVISERQTNKVSQVAIGAATISSFRAPVAVFSAILPELRQNSPPQSSSSPSLAFLCTFRI